MSVPCALLVNQSPVSSSRQIFVWSFIVRNPVRLVTEIDTFKLLRQNNALTYLKAEIDVIFISLILYENMSPNNNIELVGKVICVRLHSDFFVIYLETSIIDLGLSHKWYDQLWNQENKIIPMNYYREYV
jgi:hypothetical protein